MAKIDKIRTELCGTLTGNIESGFPKKSTHVASAFGILGMRSLSFLSNDERAEYGVKEMQTLTDFYGQKIVEGDRVSEPLIEKDTCLAEWTMAKEVVLQNHYPRDSLSKLYKLLFEFHKDSFPNLLILTRLALVIPFQTADCERGFSCQNAIQTAKRNRLKEDKMNVLMTIKCEGGCMADYDFAPAAALWRSKKRKEIVQKVGNIVRLHTFFTTAVSAKH